MKIFVSCVSVEFPNFRNEIASDLRSRFGEHAHVLTQEDFPLLPGVTLLERLEQAVDSCDVVVTIIGHSYGAEPTRTERGEHPRRSYTQWEYFFACGQRLNGTVKARKDIYILFVDDSSYAVQAANQPHVKSNLQNRFRKYITDTGLARAKFQGLSDLRPVLLKSIQPPGGGSSATLQSTPQPVPGDPSTETGQSTDMANSNRDATIGETRTTAATKAEVLCGVLDGLKLKLDQNANLSLELAALYIPSTKDPDSDELITCLKGEDAAASLAKMYRWLERRPGLKDLDDLRVVANAVAVLHMPPGWLESARPRLHQGNLDVPDLLEARSAELLVAGLLNRAADLVQRGGNFVGARSVEYSQIVPTPGISVIDRAMFFRDAIAAHFRISASNPRLDDLLCEALQFEWDDDNPTYILFENDAKLPGLLDELKRFNWQEHLLTLRPTKLTLEEQAFRGAFRVALHLEKICRLIDSRLASEKIS